MWLLGNGQHISFWFDNWCGDSLIKSLNVTTDMIEDYTVSEYIENFNWKLESLEQRFPDIRRLVSQVTIPLLDKPDSLMWKHNSSGILTLKDAFDFKRHHFPKLTWTKPTWSKDISPSKSLLLWRLMHDKLPTDENLTLRGCFMPSMCYL